jgi:ADP-glucose pyrophosphorylase
VIGENARVSYSIIDSDVSVGAGSTIGKSKSDATGITVIGTKIKIPDGTELADAKMIYTEKDLKAEV